MNDDLRERLGGTIGKLESVLEAIDEYGVGERLINALDSFLDSSQNCIDNVNMFYTVYGDKQLRFMMNAIDMLGEVIFAYHKSFGDEQKQIDIYNINNGLIWELWDILCEQGKMGGIEDSADPIAWNNRLISANTLARETLSDLICKIEYTYGKYRNIKVSETESV